MRGSLKNQITAALKCCCKFKESRHLAKQQHDGRSPFIHSLGTFDKAAHRLWPLRDWLKERGIRDLELLDGELIWEYLKERLAYHIANGNSRQSFKVEVSALGNLERGLTLFSKKHRALPRKYDFADARGAFSTDVRLLPRQTSAYENRALPAPEILIEALSEERHKLMASLQLHSGCRAEGVGAPQREGLGGNPLKRENFMSVDAVPLLPLCDPVTGQAVQTFWTREKGGKVAWKYCPVPLADQVLSWIGEHPEGLRESYPVYLAAINKAMRDTGQYVRGRGTHALRFNFAQRRYGQCITAGFGDEEAKRLVSMEMSHNRPDITEGYCR